MALRYPISRTVEAIEERAGVRSADPYRWLEESTDEVRMWQKDQARLASTYIRDWPHFDAVRELVGQYWAPTGGSVPRYVAGRWFRGEISGGGRAPRVVAAEEPFGVGEVVVDLADLYGEDETPVLSWLSPSPDGRILAVGVCTDGSEQNTIRLVDVETGVARTEAPPQVLHDSWSAGAAWLPDSSGFYYVALTGTVRDFQKAVYSYRLGDPAPTRHEPVPGLPVGLPYGNNWSLVQVSCDGRWATVVHRLKTPVPVALKDLTDPLSPWRPFITDIADSTVAGHVVGDRYVAVTDVDAPRGRLVAIPIDADKPNDVSTWTELVPESDTVLRSVTPVGDLLYVTELVDTYTRVRIVDQDGQAVGHLPLPDKGAVGIAQLSLPLLELIPRGHPNEFIFTFSTPTRSWAVYRHRPGDTDVELLKPSAVTIEDAVVDEHQATSPDGTVIRYQTVRRTGIDTTTPAPALIYSYGGYNAATLPAYQGNKAAGAFVAAGGAFVYAHIRGGGDFGREWWEGGRRSNKQNGYDDLHAVAEDLLSRGISSAGALGVIGESNGGLMSAVALTQRPDLWRVAVPRVPPLDLIGWLRTPFGEQSIRGELVVDPDDPAEIRRLQTISPYHLVRDGTEYPAVYVAAGETDPRCMPWLARKFVARLQAAHSGSAPILLHVRDNVGHGAANPKDAVIDEISECLAFIMRELGMTPPKEKG